MEHLEFHFDKKWFVSWGVRGGILYTNGKSATDYYFMIGPFWFGWTIKS